MYVSLRLRDCKETCLHKRLWLVGSVLKQFEQNIIGSK